MPARGVQRYHSHCKRNHIGGSDLHPTLSVHKPLWSNKLLRIYEHYAFEVLWRSGMSRSKGWLMGNCYIPLAEGEILTMGKICSQRYQFPRDSGQTKVAWSVYDTFMRLLNVVEALGAKGGSCCAKIWSPPRENSYPGDRIINHGYSSHCI